MTPNVKCLVWDLDQTLWRGVLLEDGEVELPEEIRAVIIELDERGILQSVASRNDHDHAWERLEKLGIAEYFVIPQIGWGRKSDSVQQIATRLNFAPSTVAFIDDQATERAEVAYHLPEVRCYPAQQAASLPSLPEFTPTAVTSSARERRLLYQAGFRRDAERASFAGPDEDFLRSLKMAMTIERATVDHLARVEELTLRTSQMNATGVHYSAPDLRGLLEDPRHEVLVVSMADRFGSHGAIGVLLLEKHLAAWHLKLLATSCRVVSFGAGTVILRWLADQATSAGVHLLADFRKTARNRMMEVAYRFAGFDSSPCSCRADVDESDVERLHLVPRPHSPSTVMQVTAPDLSQAKTLYQWFSDSADRFPAAPALEVRGESFTYSQLRSLAEALAAKIVSEHGSVPERVALLASRTVVAFAGYLAVQRLGATVIPLNPSYPVERNRTICALTAPDVLLADRAPIPFESTVVSVTSVDSLPAGELPPYEPVRDSLAYILFTSGSTGVPKGVPIRHHQVSPYLARGIARYQMGPGCRTSHTFDLTFDPSLFDLFVTWGGGGTLVVPQKAELLAPVDYIVEGRITHWYSVPSVLSVSATLGNLPEGMVTSLRYSIFVGEPLTYRHCVAWRSVAPGTVIENVYGPTEMSVTCTAYALPDDPAQWPVTSNDTAPIGAVHESLDYVLVGDELCIRGRQRFDGYLDPAENKDRFLTVGATGVEVYDGAGPLTDEHYYRTGDRISIEDGHWVHRGRLDNQVKVRGHRVELGEVEAAMLRYPGVQEAVVIAVRSGDETELVGVHTGPPVPAAEFMLWLRQRIPVHMVPRRFLQLTAFPLNANGKADRRALTELVTR